MTKKELKQIGYLNKEIEMWKERLAEIEYDLSLQSPNWRILGCTSGHVSDKTADLAARIEKIKRIIEGRLIEIQEQRKRILDFIEGIDDSLIRQIVQYRYVSCMGWAEIARRIGGNNTADGIRMAHDRFIKEK